LELSKEDESGKRVTISLARSDWAVISSHLVSGRTSAFDAVSYGAAQAKRKPERL